uniref:Bis(5'-nucleosyl)-tetraphosphatase [asymmetrical] n=1 Tax=Candidatus Methanomethylicus mesodigestus TaxID=1867258 RepID=A0A7C3J4F3_9CREN
MPKFLKLYELNSTAFGQRGMGLRSFRQERSAGVLVYRNSSPVLYLLLQTNGRYDIPKGQLNMGESEIEGALRELREETGIADVRILPEFRKCVNYCYYWQGTLVRKEVIYFLGETSTKDVCISKEHDSFCWMTKEEVINQVSYKNLKDVVSEADSIICQGSSK